MTGSLTPTLPGQCSKGATEHTGRKARPSTRNSPSKTRVSPRIRGRNLVWSNICNNSSTLPLTFLLARGKRREELYDYGAVMLDKFKKKSKMIAKVVTTLRDDDEAKKKEINQTVPVKETEAKSKSIPQSSEDLGSSLGSLSSR